MKCPLCNIEMFAISNRMVVENDDTAEKETKLYVEHNMACRNKNCPNNGKVVLTVKDEIKIG